MKKIYSFAIQVVSKIMLLCFVAMLIISFGIKAVYNYNDSPIFEKTQMLDIVFEIIVVGVFVAGVHWRKKINQISAKISIIIFVILAFLFVIMVPLKPFSDMQQIYNGALNIAEGNMKYFTDNSYFMEYPNNILITLIYGAILFIFPHNFIVLKFTNIFCVIGIVWMSEKILQLYWKNSYTNLFYLYGLSLGSVFLYVNHVYTDLVFVFVATLGLYIYMKNTRKIIGVVFLFSVLYFVRPQAIFYMIAIIIHYFFKSEKNLCYKIITILIGAIIFVICNFVITQGIEKTLIGDIEHSMPPASYVYMAFNEKEFGFQDGSHDTKRTFADVKERIESYNGETLAQIILKKEQWMWTEGTYQAQRYAFGGDDSSGNKFIYQTPITKYCLDSSDDWRKGLDCFLRSQYLIMLILTVPMFAKKNNREYDIFIMLFAANIVFYIFWEIKSRYILPLYPVMLIISCLTLKNIVKRISKK